MRSRLLHMYFIFIVYNIELLDSSSLYQTISHFEFSKFQSIELFNCLWVLRTKAWIAIQKDTAGSSGWYRILRVSKTRLGRWRFCKWLLQVTAHTQKCPQTEIHGTVPIAKNFWFIVIAGYTRIFAWLKLLSPSGHSKSRKCNNFDAKFWIYPLLSLLMLKWRNEKASSVQWLKFQLSILFIRPFSRS